MSLTVSQNRGNVIDRAIVNFNGSNNLHKFMMNPAHTNLSIAKGGETFAAISTEAEGELPVNFKAEKDGTYTISVNTENVEANYLHLIDNLTGMDTDLLSTPSYTFNATTSGYASRPRLRPRLTQGRSALPWNPWIFGRKDSHLTLATHSGILSSEHSTPPYRCSFFALSMLLYHSYNV